MELTVAFCFVLFFLRSSFHADSWARKKIAFENTDKPTAIRMTFKNVPYVNQVDLKWICGKNCATAIDSFIYQSSMSALVVDAFTFGNR